MALCCKAVVDSRLCQWCVTHDQYLLVFIVEENLDGIDVVVSDVTLSYHGLGIHMTCHRANCVKK